MWEPPGARSRKNSSPVSASSLKKLQKSSWRRCQIVANFFSIFRMFVFSDIQGSYVRYLDLYLHVICMYLYVRYLVSGIFTLEVRGEGRLSRYHAHGRLRAYARTREPASTLHTCELLILVPSLNRPAQLFFFVRR